MKRCGLYIRVSTKRQAKVEEGSLKNQDQLLTQHVEIKNKLNLLSPAIHGGVMNSPIRGDSKGIASPWNK